MKGHYLLITTVARKCLLKMLIKLKQKSFPIFKIFFRFGHKVICWYISNLLITTRIHCVNCIV